MGDGANRIVAKRARWENFTARPGRRTVNTGKSHLGMMEETALSEETTEPTTISAVLGRFVADPTDVEAATIKRSLLAASSSLPKEWQVRLSEEARVAYNRCLERHDAIAGKCSTDAMRALSLMRLLCLTLVESGGSNDTTVRDIDKSQHAKHWARTGLQFVLCRDTDDAERCFNASQRLLRETADPESIEVLEIDLQLRVRPPLRISRSRNLRACSASAPRASQLYAPCAPSQGYLAHLEWARGDFKLVLRHVEEAHALLEQRGGGAAFMLVSSRMYLAEQVAFRLATRGFDLAEAADAPADGGSGAIERRDLLRLLDIAQGMLGGAPSTDVDDMGIVPLRDKVLRLRAWICMLEDEMDMATHALNQHSAQVSSPEFMMLRCALLFRSNQPAEASAQILEWLRSQSDLACVTYFSLSRLPSND